MSTQLQLEFAEPEARATVVTASGDLDLVTASELYRGVADAFERHPVLILELSGIGFCDSSGFNALLRLRRRAEEQGTRFALAAPPELVRRLMTLTGADAVFHIHDDVAGALGSHLA